MNSRIVTKANQKNNQRTINLTKKQKVKLQEYSQETDISQEEKKLKENQIKSFITVLPLTVVCTIFKEMSSLNQTKAKKECPSLAKKVNEEKPNKNHSKDHGVVIEEEQTSINIPNTTISQDFKKIEDNEIITYYETKLKKIKTELKEISYEYQIIDSSASTSSDLDTIQKLLDRLTLITNKLEALKQALNAPQKAYNQEAIKELITIYLNDFNQNKPSPDIKDSDLYILLSKKIEELEERKKIILTNLDLCKKQKNIDEEHFSKLKSSYDSFDDFNRDLLKFQIEEESLAKRLNQKLVKANSEEEKITYKLRFLNNRSRVIRDLISPQVLIPGPKSALRIASLTISLIHVFRNHLQPRVEEEHYKNVIVTDYEQEITNSLASLAKTLTLISKTKQQLTIIIKDLKNEYQDYFGKVKEYDKLLENLEEISISLTKKEEELIELKQEQENNLTINNNKVKIIEK